ncbi:ribosomal oxygenase 2-like [Stylophora pistillata]|uniref:ribosomal oxygenase 2-like n=1 Tax=Stylophora pistillata TaxID=50429 RepID=UPI000C04A218|nr:ribosomal oxygenase 2-like [Stylophora pistillata]
MKRKGRAASASATSPDGKKTKVEGENDPETSTTVIRVLDFSSPKKVAETLLAVANLETFFAETWEKKPYFVKRENTDFYGPLFSRKDLEAVLKKEEIQFIEDLNLSRYVEGKTELLNEEGSRVNSKHIKANGVAVQFHQPDRFKDEIWKLVESLESYLNCLVFVDAFVFQPGSQGLAPQHDDLETFILQTEGKTKWKLFKPLQELSQDASPDLELKDIGEPTEEFDLEPGDLLYFPRGSIFFPVPVEDKNHTTYLALTTFQESSWGNMLTSVLTKAVEKAMESDVEYRRGLPVNFPSFMGNGLHETDSDQDPPEQNDNLKSDKEESHEKATADPRTAFNKTLINLVLGLEQHMSPDKAVDNMMYEFFNNRLPPYAKDIKKGSKKRAPTDENRIRILHPEHVRVIIGDLSDGVAGADESDEDVSQAEEEGEENSEEEESEDSENEDKKGSKRGAKKDKGGKTEKVKGTKSKSKKAEEEGDDDEEDMEDEEEGSEDEDDPFDNKEGGDEYLLLLHSYNNDRATHMMGNKTSCSTLKFPIRYKGALRQIISGERDEYVTVSSLELLEKERLSMVKSLWNEGLLEVE